MEKILKLYSFIDGANSEPFPSLEHQLTISDFTYNAKRNSILSTISATTYHHLLLHDKWDYTQYVEFKGEKFWVLKKPSYTKDNTNSRYKYEIELVNHRNILNNILFYDTVDSTTDDVTIANKYSSHSTKVLFYGTIRELVVRLNASIAYAKVNYTIVVDDNISKEKLEASKEFQADSISVADALNQAFNLYDIPYYCVGNEIHFGYYSTNLNTPLQYGYDKSLISIQKNNANKKIITRATGLGSSDNIPYYYPNNSGKGNIKFTLYDTNNNDITSSIDITSHQLISQSTTIDDVYTYKDIADYSESIIDIERGYMFKDGDVSHWDNGQVVDIFDVQSSNRHSFELYFNISKECILNILVTIDSDELKFNLSDFSSIQLWNQTQQRVEQKWYNPSGDSVTMQNKILPGDYVLTLSSLNVGRAYPLVRDLSYTLTVQLQDVTPIEPIYKWVNKKGDYISTLKDIGIDYDEKINTLGYRFVVSLLDKLPFQPQLMPSIYTKGAAFDGNVIVDKRGYERYYDAKNNTYNINNEEVIFINPLNEFNISEAIYEYEDIKPEIKGVVNANNELICEVVDIAYDDNDNDNILTSDGSNNYEHPYFYIKLRKFDGKFGFNLFAHSIETDEMTLQITSGNLNGCKFKVQGVKKGVYFANPVQVDENGYIVKGDYNQKINTNNIQEQQQDTRNNEIWIAVLKEYDTFGIIMPNATMNYRMQKGDTFNIIHILLPQIYIDAAEKRLDESIIYNLKENNEEVFDHSISFSRIFLQEDYLQNQQESVLSILNEASKVNIFDGFNVLTQYVTSYTYKRNENDALPIISIELEQNIKHRTTYLDDISNKITVDTNEKISTISKDVQKTSNQTSVTLEAKASKATTLAGYGIEDAKIEEDGTIRLGNNSIKIPKKEEDFLLNIFALDDNGDVYVLNRNDGSPRNFYTYGAISWRGVSTSGGGGTGGGLIQRVYGYDNITDIFDNSVKTDTFNAYTIAKIAERVSNIEKNGVGGDVDLTGYATEDWVLSKDYATNTAVATLQLAHNTLRSEFDALNNVLNDDVSGKINTWNEVVDFLDEYSGSQDLATILAGINGDISTLQGKFTKDNIQTTLGIADWALAASKPSYNFSEILNKPTTLAGYGITDALSTSGGRIAGNYGALDIYRNTGNHPSLLKFSNLNGTLGYIGFNADKEPVYFTDSLSNYILIHSGNIDDYALPLSGGIINGDLTIGESSASTTTQYYLRMWKEEGGQRHRAMLHVNADGTHLSYYNATTGAFTKLVLGASTHQLVTYNTIYDIIHSGNIGEQSVEASSSFNITLPYSSSGVDLNTLTNGGTAINYGNAKAWVNGPSGMNFGTVLNLKSNEYNYLQGQLAWDINHNSTTDTTRNLWWRAISAPANVAYAQWHQIAFTDSNVASASKLQTARTIWGQSFDGTGDVNGDLVGVGSINSTLQLSNPSSVARLHIHGNSATVDYVHLFVSNSSVTQINRPLVVQKGFGNVLIGTATEDYSSKLLVNGNISSRGDFQLISNSPSTTSNSGKLKFNALDTDVAGPYIQAINAENYGRARLAIFQHNVANYSSATEVMSIMPNGNVLIGTTTDNGNKLQINGNVRFDGQTRINGSMRFYGKTSLSSDMYIDNQSVGGLNFAWSDGVSRFFIGDKVGIGTNAPQYKLDVNGSVAFGNSSACDVWLRRANGNSYIAATSSLMFSVNGSSSNYALGIDTSKNATFYGNISATGSISWGAASDRRLKDNIKTISSEDAIKVIMALNPVTFEWNKTATEKDNSLKGLSCGFIADEYTKVIPNSSRPIWEEYTAIDYKLTAAFVVKGLQSHEERLRVLERENRELKNELNKLRGYGN